MGGEISCCAFFGFFGFYWFSLFFYGFDGMGRTKFVRSNGGLEPSLSLRWRPLVFLELPSKIGLGDEGDEMRNRVAKRANVAEQMGARLYGFHMMEWDDDRFHAKPRVAISKRP